MLTHFKEISHIFHFHKVWVKKMQLLVSGERQESAVSVLVVLSCYKGFKSPVFQVCMQIHL